jgi:hypothetical protein
MRRIFILASILISAVVIGAQGAPKTVAEQVTADRTGLSVLTGTNVQAVLEDISASLSAYAFPQRPYYTVKLDANGGLTNSAEFTNVLAVYRVPSCGSIFEPKNNLRQYDQTNSLCYSMRVYAVNQTSKTMQLFAADDFILVYVNESLVWSRTYPANGAVFGSSASPTNVIFTIPAGSNTVKIVRNDAYGGERYLELSGNIVDGTNVFFIGD